MNGIVTSGVTANLTYGSGFASGVVSFAEVTFSGYTVEGQAFSKKVHPIKEAADLTLPF